MVVPRRAFDDDVKSWWPVKKTKRECDRGRRRGHAIPPARRGPGIRKLYALVLCRVADQPVSKSGDGVSAGLRVPVLCLHDGSAARVGEDHAPCPAR